LINECITKKFEDDELTWNALKKYSVILWYDNMAMLKEWVEKIAVNEYRKSDK